MTLAFIVSIPFVCGEGHFFGISLANGSTIIPSDSVQLFPTHFSCVVMHHLAASIHNTVHINMKG